MSSSARADTLALRVILSNYRCDASVFRFAPNTANVVSCVPVVLAFQYWTDAVNSCLRRTQPEAS